MKCPRCGAGISTKLLDRPHYRFMKRKYRRYAPPGIRRAVCSFVVSSDPLQRALDMLSGWGIRDPFALDAST